MFKLLSFGTMVFAVAVTGSFLIYQNMNKPTAKTTIVEPQVGQAIAIFAGGCFWCTESDFEKLDGVIAVISGYIGGSMETADYKTTSAGGTGHRESVQVIYDPTKISYRYLVDYHWQHFDPTDLEGQFFDRGFQYSPAVFYSNDAEKLEAEASLQALNDRGVFDQEIKVPIVKATTFYPAEEYHQDYYLKAPNRYKFYRAGSGRDRFIKKYWK